MKSADTFERKCAFEEPISIPKMKNEKLELKERLISKTIN